MTYRILLMGNLSTTVTTTVVRLGASILGGGKFANGAVTTTFSRLFGDVVGAGQQEGNQDSERGSGFLKPIGHDYDAGRPDTIIEPGGWFGRFIEDYLPGIHTLAINHDSLVGYLNKQLGIPDLIANAPTIPITYVYSVTQEFLNIPTRNINFIFDANLSVPFGHIDPER